MDRVPPSDTWELRQAVLRPHETIGQQALPDDDQPSTGSFAAINERGEVVSTARVAPACPPFSLGGNGPDDVPTWQVRGMATRDDVRNIGIGSAVLGRVIDYVAERGGGILWCNARLPAMNLYRRAGFVEQGDAWEDPDIGPHVVMWRFV